MEIGAGPGIAVAEQQKTPENTQARRAAEKLVRQRTKEIKTKVETGSRVSIDQLPPGEKVLYTADLLREGLGDDYGPGIAMKDINADAADDLLSIKTQEGAPDIVISKITGEKRTADGTLTYICETPTGSTEEISADKLLAAHTEHNASAIAGVFSGDQAMLVEWYAQGAENDCPVSDDQIAAFDATQGTEQEQQSQTTIDIFIGQQIDALQTEIAQLEASNPKRDQLAQLLKDLQIATFKRGPVGILYKEEALKKLSKQRGSEGTTGVGLVAQIDQQLASLRENGALENAEDALIAFLDEKMPDDDKAKRREELVDKVYNGEALAVLQEKDISSLDGTNELIFGDKDMTDKIVESLLNNQNVDESTKQMLKENWKKGGKIAGISLLALLLSLPAVAIGSTFVALRGVGGPQ